MAPKKPDQEVNMDQLQQQMSRIAVSEMEQTRGRVDSLEQTLQAMQTQMSDVFGRWEQRRREKEETKQRLLEKARGKCIVGEDPQSEVKNTRR
uniref:Uncharacterized protein n=1 Tax=Brassica oleracea var. oleracea TaxID=109376 RepID=A0A0D3ECB8_BRAOL